MKAAPSKKEWWGLVFIAPWLLGFLGLVAGPIIASMVLSFFAYDPGFIRPVGVTNYSNLLLHDPKFVHALINTLTYTLWAVPLGLTGSLLLAVLLNQNLKAKGLWRACFYVPTLVPIVASSLLWRYMFNEYTGLINTTLRATGLPQHDMPQWFGSTTMALPTMVLMSLWGIGGARMIIFLAGLQNIPQAMYEAAAIDGATRWRQFLHVTLPMLSPVIFFNAILGAVGAFQVFAQAMLITSGGPLDATLFSSLYLFQKAFTEFHMGYACAMAWLLFVVLASITGLQFFASRFWVHYEGER